jgi:O-antigen/teichoic acid export membrane protein
MHALPQPDRLPEPVAPPDPVDATTGPTAGRAVADIALQIVGRLVNGVFGVVVLVILTRALGKSEFGVWSTLSTVVFLGGALTDLGFTSLAVRYAASNPDDASGWLGSLLIVRVATSVIAAGGCALAALALNRGHMMVLAGAILSVTVLYGGVSSLSAAFQLRVRNDLTIVVLTVGTVLWTGGAIAAAVFDLHLVGFALVFSAASIVTTTFGAWLALRQMHVSLAGWKPRILTFIRVGLPLSISALLIYSYARVDQILVFRYAGSSAAGLYGVAYRVLDQATVIPLSITTTLYPLIIRAQSRSLGDLRFIVQAAFESMWALSLGAVVVAVVCGGPLMGLVFGSAYAVTGPTLAVLMGAFVVISLNYLIGSFILVFNLQGFTSVVSLLGLIFNVAFNIIFIPRWGYLAAAIATTATELLVLILNGRRVITALGFRPRLAAGGRALLAALISVAALQPLRLAAPVEVTFLAGLGLYVGLLVSMRAVDFRGLVNLVRNRKPA